MQRFRQLLDPRIVEVIGTGHQILDVQIAAFFYQQGFIGIDPRFQRIVGEYKRQIDLIHRPRQHGAFQLANFKMVRVGDDIPGRRLRILRVFQGQQAGIA